LHPIIVYTAEVLNLNLYLDFNFKYRQKIQASSRIKKKLLEIVDKIPLSNFPGFVKIKLLRWAVVFHLQDFTVTKLKF